MAGMIFFNEEGDEMGELVSEFPIRTRTK